MNYKFEGVDFAEGLARFRNNAERYTKALYKFASGLDESAMPFEEAIQPENLAETKNKVHTLKGVAGNLSVKDIFTSCAEFERTLAAGAPDKGFYEGIYRACADFKAEILAKLQPDELAASGVGSREGCMALLNELSGHASSYNAEACERIIAKLRGKKWAGIEQPILNVIYDYIENYDFEDAVMLIDTLK